jgi:hypothetical protein
METVVTTHRGKLRGNLSIPYAMPLFNANRLLPPRPVEPSLLLLATPPIGCRSRPPLWKQLRRLEPINPTELKCPNRLLSRKSSALRCE